MQGNDIGVSHAWKHVVIMEQTLIAPPPLPRKATFRTPTRLTREAKRARLLEEWLGEWELNRIMCQWIVWQAQGGAQSEIWSFLPEEQFTPLSARIHQVAEDGIVGWERWVDPLDALTRLRSDPTIDAVYDADYERIATLWKMRGHAVRGGMAP